MQTKGIDMLHNEQRQDIMSKMLALQICHGSKNSSKSFTLFADGVLQKHWCVHCLQHDITIAPHSLVPTLLYEFHEPKGHQGNIHTFEAIRRSYWWPKL